MALRSAILPPIPATTVRAAEAALGKGNLYVAIGDQAGQLIEDVGPAGWDWSIGLPALTLARLSLVTSFQAAEHLPDDQASEAVRSRTDWKYALHLPMESPGFEPSLLCHFRQEILTAPEGQTTFERLLLRLVELGLNIEPARPTDIVEVLAAVCVLSRMEALLRAMSQALEGIAARRPDWLRANSLPHWYERYGHRPTFVPPTRSREVWEQIAGEIGSDAEFLLKSLLGVSAAGLEAMAEIQVLRREYRRQFERADGQGRWRPQSCFDCRGANAFIRLIP